jgi:2-polyprenyl-3-methyl-5-hydroxy-6-metoxy-1,4-benzoquinol methylase
MTASLPTLDRPSCPLCNSVDHRSLYRGRDDRYGHPDEYPINYCPSCDLAYLGRIVTAESTKTLYAEHYPHTCVKAGYFWNSHWSRRLARWLDGNINPMQCVKPTDTVLDVGCGPGVLLMQARSIGAAAMGLEIDPAAVAAAQSRDLEVELSTVEDFAQTTNRRFTKVILNQVIEHVPNPMATLEACRSLLRPRGRIVMTTVVYGSWLQRRTGTQWIGWHVPYHIHWFSPRALTSLAKRCGMCVTKVIRRTPANWFLAQCRLSRRSDAEPSRRSFLAEFPLWKRALVAPVVRTCDALATPDAIMLELSIEKQ